jgi:UDP-N-acetylglucosamine 1-carboxyvinyltransferase
MSTLKINGGNPIQGTVKPVGNKNSILPLICAAVLTDEEITFHNVPKSSSVRTMLQVFQNLGGSVKYLKDNSVKLCAKGMNSYIIDKDLSKKERASMMLLGPLLCRFKKAEIGDAGGCKLGNRPIDTLFQGLVALGADVNDQNIYQLTTKGIKANPFYWQLETSVTGTESFILTAVLAKGTSVIYNAACEPHVQDLCNFLVSIGAKINGIGSNKLTIEGVDKLNGGEWKVISDFIDIGGLVVAAAITGGELRITDAIPEHMQLVLNYFKKVNLNTFYEGNTLVIPKEQDLYCKPNLKGDMDKVPDQPWPTAFPVDLVPQMIVLAAKAKGSIRIHSIMYETQLFFVEELLKMRAKVMLADTHTVVTFGPSDFRGASTTASNVLQCAHAQFLTALAAKGTSTLHYAEIISRRYPDIISTYQALGGDITSER